MSESLGLNPELAQATNEFIAGIKNRAPQYEQGEMATFVEDGRLQRSNFESRYTCMVKPMADAATPPTVVMVYGPSPICHERQVFDFDEPTQQYWKTVIEAEPRWETTPPLEYFGVRKPATALELGKALGILEFLVLQPSEPVLEPSEAESAAEPEASGSSKWPHRLLSLLIP